MKGFLKIAGGLTVLGLVAACSKGHNVDKNVQETRLRAMCKSEKAFNLGRENFNRLSALQANAAADLRTTLYRDDYLGICKVKAPLEQKAASDVIMQGAADSVIDVVRVETNCDDLTGRVTLPHRVWETVGKITSIDENSIEINDGKSSIRVEKVMPVKNINSERHNLKNYKTEVTKEYQHAKMLDEQGFNVTKVTIAPLNAAPQEVAMGVSTVILQETVPSDLNASVALHASTLNCLQEQNPSLFVNKSNIAPLGDTLFTVGELLDANIELMPIPSLPKEQETLATQQQKLNDQLNADIAGSIDEKMANDVNDQLQADLNRKGRVEIEDVPEQENEMLADKDMDVEAEKDTEAKETSDEGAKVTGSGIKFPTIKSAF